MCGCANYLQFGNMNLISLTAAWNESLPWRAFCSSEVPYFALRLKKSTAFFFCTSAYEFNRAHLYPIHLIKVIYQALMMGQSKDTVKRPRITIKHCKLYTSQIYKKKCHVNNTHYCCYSFVWVQGWGRFAEKYSSAFTPKCEHAAQYRLCNNVSLWFSSILFKI